MWWRWDLSNQDGDEKDESNIRIDVIKRIWWWGRTWDQSKDSCDDEEEDDQWWWWE
jgi:hypothetical protein